MTFLVNYVLLHDYDEAHRKPKKRVMEGLIKIRRDQIGAILPRKTYTTLIVQGKYIHVTELFDEVERKIAEFDRETT